MKRRHGINTSHTKHLSQSQQSQSQQQLQQQQQQQSEQSQTIQSNTLDDPLTASHTEPSTVQVSNYSLIYYFSLYRVSTFNQCSQISSTKLSRSECNVIDSLQITNFLTSQSFTTSP